MPDLLTVAVVVVTWIVGSAIVGRAFGGAWEKPEE